MSPISKGSKQVEEFAPLSTTRRMPSSYQEAESDGATSTMRLTSPAPKPTDHALAIIRSSSTAGTSRGQGVTLYVFDESRESFSLSRNKIFSGAAGRTTREHLEAEWGSAPSDSFGLTEVLPDNGRSVHQSKQVDGRDGVVFGSSLTVMIPRKSTCPARTTRTIIK